MSRARQKGGRVTPKGIRSHNESRFTAQEIGELEDTFETVLRGAREDLSTDCLLDAELWASRLWDVAASYEVVDGREEGVGAELIRYLSWQRTEESVRVLRALAAVAPAPYGRRAAAAADRLVRRDVPDPAWAPLVGDVRPVEACLLEDVVDDDGVDVMIAFDGAAGPHTVVMYVDHNLGGIAKDAFCVDTPISEVVRVVTQHADGASQATRPITIEEAAARWRAALEATDTTIAPPVSDELRAVRALLESRLSTLPATGEVPAADNLFGPARQALLDEFMASDEAGAADDIEELALNVMHYALDYAGGAPLRFSPVMVEIFCCDWAPRHVVADEARVGLLPDVLRAWIRFAGRRRGIPQGAIDEAVAAVDTYRDDLLDAAADEHNWGPVKSVAMMMLEDGIDLADSDAVRDYIDDLDDERVFR